MKVLVLSDSHGAVHHLKRILEKESDADFIFFLGDGLGDIEKVKNQYPQKKFISVKGNNDYYYHEEREAYKYIEGVTIMACHGDAFGVRSGVYELIKKVSSVRGNLALYGHTHVSNFYNDAATGICAVNPGAVCDGKYCVLEIEKGQFEYYPRTV